MCIPGPFPWTSGQGKPHPDAEAIIAWARGQEKLDIIHVPTQTDLEVRSVWIATEFPVMNPACKRVRIRPRKRLCCGYRRKDETTSMLFTVLEGEEKGWEARHPDLIRISDWTPVLVD